MYCHRCGTQLPENSVACYRCGNQIYQKPEAKTIILKSGSVIVLIIVTVIAFISVVIGFFLAHEVFFRE